MMLGSLTMGRRCTWEIPRMVLGLGITILFPAVDVSEVVLNGFGSQWTCLASGQERVWLVKNRCFRCGCLDGHEAQLRDPCIVGPMGSLPKGRLPRKRPSTSLSLQLVRRKISLRWPSLYRLVQLMLLRLALFPRSQRDALIGSKQQTAATAATTTTSTSTTTSTTTCHG